MHTMSERATLALGHFQHVLAVHDQLTASHSEGRYGLDPDGRAAITKEVDGLFQYLIDNWTPDETNREEVKTILENRALTATWHTESEHEGALPILYAKALIGIHKIPMDTRISKTFDTFVEKYKDVILGR